MVTAINGFDLSVKENPRALKACPWPNQSAAGGFSTVTRSWKMFETVEVEVVCFENIYKEML